MNEEQPSKSHFLFAIHLTLFYISVLLLNGYQFGSGDMTESLSLVLHHHNPELFSKDLYINSMTQNAINERLPFVWLLGIWAVQTDWWAFFLHAVCSLSLFAGLYKIASLVLTSGVLKWIALFIIVVGLQGIHLGGNDLYDSLFAPSFPAKALGVWAVYFFLRDRPAPAIPFLVTGGLFQPLVAAQLFLLFLCVTIIQLIREKRPWEAEHVKAILLAIPLVAYLILLQYYHQSEPIPTDQYFQIIHLRMDHHFFPDAFGLKNYAIYTILFTSSLFYFYSRNKKWFWFSIFIAIGCLVYSLGLLLEIKPALMTQWFKSTMWLEVFGVIALLAWLERRLHLPIRSILLLGSTCLLAFIWAVMAWPPLQDKSYDFGANWQDQELVQIAKRARQNSSTDAVFIIPPEVSHFRHIAGRSVYVDFKSMAHNTFYLKKWSRRIEKIYGLNAFDGNPNGGFERIPEASTFYLNLSKAKLSKLRIERGVTHILTYRAHQLDFPIIAKTENYLVYKITKKSLQ
ncbi:MAG: hypothetical protein GVX96_01705 [Bacteroidetes bacterium]|jgi:hypothetical protein|nr:hypothetical protein [Bacteroidota bacterium]